MTRMNHIPSIAQAMLVKGSSLPALLIQRATASPYSHIAFAIEGQTYEMDFGGFYSRKIVEYGWDYDLFDIEGMDEQKTHILRRWCLTNKSVPYDYGKVFGQGLEILCRLVGSRALLDRRAALSCTEMFINGLTVVSNPLVSCSATCATPADISKDPLLRFVRSCKAYGRV